VRVALGSTLKPAESVKLEHMKLRPSEKLRCAGGSLLYEEKGQTLIFTAPARAQRLAKELDRDGFSTALIHGDRTSPSATPR